MKTTMYFYHCQSGTAAPATAKPVDRVRRSRDHKRQECDPLQGSQAHQARVTAPCRWITRPAPSLPGRTGFWAT